MQKLMSRMRAAMEKYDMVSDGDKIAVGVSGGKDSLVLLTALAQMRWFYPQKYELVAVTLDMRFGNTDGDYSEIAALCERLSVPYSIKRTELSHVIFEVRDEKNPCSLCAKMRRGILHDAAKELGCNKIALGHHMDDAAETFMMNLLRGGNVACFSPVSYLSIKDLYLIRPMILAREGTVVSVAQKLSLPVKQSCCPMDGVSERQKTKELLNSLEREYPALREKIIGAMQRSGIDKW